MKPPTVNDNAQSDESQGILQRLADSSRPFGTKVVIKGDTAEVGLGGGK